jgi:hypothetical protein
MLYLKAWQYDDTVARIVTANVTVAGAGVDPTYGADRRRVSKIFLLGVGSY